jgi:DNA-binding NarL/FixJ family response regulator
MDNKRILVADDHPLSREGLALAVRHAISGAAIVAAGTIAQAEAAIGKRGSFALVLLDLMLPDTHGFSGLLKLQFALPGVPIVVITANEDPALVGTARELGAAGFLPKSMPLDEIAEALRGIIGGNPVFPRIPHGAIDRAEAGAAPMRDRIAQLSEAQRRVLFALASGSANKQIAHDLDVTEATIKAHLTAIFRRLGVSNRMQAMLALRPLLGDGVP